MRTLSALALACAALSAPQALADVDHGPWDALLKKHVADGKVDYAGVRADQAKLDAYLDALGKADPSKLSKAKRYAFWINAYNAFTFKGVLDKLPADKAKWGGFSVTKVPGFWKKIKYTVAGKQLTLDDMEHKVLRPVFKDARVHFAIVCASIGCPALRSEAFVASKLEAQLDEQTALFCKDASKLKIDAEKMTIAINPIFKWFGQDFVDDAGSVPKFLARHVADKALAEKLQTAKWKISFVEYDWGLNAK